MAQAESESLQLQELEDLHLHPQGCPGRKGQQKRRHEIEQAAEKPGLIAYGTEDTSWFEPTSMEMLCSIVYSLSLSKQQYRLVGGNTGHGVFSPDMAADGTLPCCFPATHTHTRTPPVLLTTLSLPSPQMSSST